MTEDTLVQLSAYLEGDLPPTQRAAIEARLARSTEWRAALDELTVLRDTVRELRVALPDALRAGFRPPTEYTPTAPVSDAFERLRRAITELRQKASLADRRRRAVALMRTTARIYPYALKEFRHG